jgi:hypothetical protein
MPHSLTSYVNLAFWLLMLGAIAMNLRELAARLRAGRVRFRLPPASHADPSKRHAVYVAAGMSACAALLLVAGNVARWWPLLPFYVGAFAFPLAQGLPRRDQKRGLVATYGVISLGCGAMCLALGLRVVGATSNLLGELPLGIWYAAAIPFLMLGIIAIAEAISGSRVRERGIELFGWTYPWSRIGIKEWYPRDDGFALRLTIGAAGPIGGKASDVVVPVSAAQRPELEAFLASRTASPSASN